MWTYARTRTTGNCQRENSNDLGESEHFVDQRTNVQWRVVYKAGRNAETLGKKPENLTSRGLPKEMKKRGKGMKEREIFKQRCGLVVVQFLDR